MFRVRETWARIKLYRASNFERGREREISKFCFVTKKKEERGDWEAIEVPRKKKRQTTEKEKFLPKTAFRARGEEIRVQLSILFPCISSSRYKFQVSTLGGVWRRFVLKLRSTICVKQSYRQLPIPGKLPSDLLLPSHASLHTWIRETLFPILETCPLLLPRHSRSADVQKEMRLNN